MEVTLWRAIRIRVLPRNAEMESKIFSPTRKACRPVKALFMKCDSSVRNVKFPSTAVKSVKFTILFGVPVSVGELFLGKNLS